MCQTTNLKKHATTLWYLHLFTEIEPPLWCFNGDGIRIPGQELGHVFEEISSLCHWINRKKSLNQQRCGNDVPDPNRNAKKKLINKHGDWTNKNGNGNNTDAEQLEWTWKSTMYILNYATKVIYRKRMGKKKHHDWACQTWKNGEMHQYTGYATPGMNHVGSPVLWWDPHENQRQWISHDHLWFSHDILIKFYEIHMCWL